MRQTTDALIIRQNNNIGEADRFVTALTRELGVIHASVRGARKWKSRSGSATELLAYSRLSVYRGREKYIVDEAEPLHLFFDVRRDIEKLALAQYFCELAGVMAPRDEAAEPYLRLLLNALHYLETGERPHPLIKAVVEWRLLGLSGYMPDLGVCAGCGADPLTETEPVLLSLPEGVLTCPRCASRGASVPVCPGVLSAMRHILCAPFEKCFAFSLPDALYPALESVAEAFLLCQLNRGFHTLDFYHHL